VSRNADIIKNATIGGNLNTNGNTTLSGILKINKGYIETSFFFTKIGNDIEGEANEDLSGSSVSLSSDGTIVAIGSPYKDISAQADRGRIKIYKYSILGAASNCTCCNIYKVGRICLKIKTTII
jgi:hypothetical protein